MAEKAPLIQAVTFDFWDTLVIDNSDEPKRAALGLPGKAAVREELLAAEILRHYPAISRQQVVEALALATQRFNHCWQDLHYTPSTAARLSDVYTLLRLDLTPGFAALVTAVERLEVDIPPDFVPGAADALEALAGRYKLGIVSDTIYTPGRNLRRILEQAGLLAYFTAAVFSDEAGAAKPEPQVFAMAAEQLGVPLTQIVHVGDREANDVAGPLALGMKAVLFTGAVDRGSEATRATAVCRRLAALPKIIAKMND